MRRWIVLLALVACTSKRAQGPGSGSAPPPAPVAATTCDEVKPRVETLYRAEAQAKEPTRVEAAVADNTAMTMTDCAKQPAVAVPCLAKVTSVAELEKQCLIPLDDEGTEGDKR